MSRIGQAQQATVHYLPGAIGATPTLTTSQRVDRAAIEAVRYLARAQLVTEAVAVRALEDFGATETEIDHIRAVMAVRRGRL